MYRFPLPKYDPRRVPPEIEHWLHERKIEYEIVEEMRQAPGFPPGWEARGPILKFYNDKDAMHFRLVWG